MTLFSIELFLTHGRTKINLIKGLVTTETDNSKTIKTFKELGFQSGENLNIDKVRSVFIFTDTDFVVELGAGVASFNCAVLDLGRTVQNIEIEELTLSLDTVFAPDISRVIVLASDQTQMPYWPQFMKPHLFYSNALTAKNVNGSGINDAADYQTILYKHTVTDKTKITTFNNDDLAQAIWVDIQHKEMGNDDENDDWVSYSGYPKPLAAGDVDSFGDDASRDTRHHHHRVRVKAQVQGQESPVKASLYGV